MCLYQEIAYRLTEMKDAFLIIKEVTLEADGDRYFTISLCDIISARSRK